MMKKVIVHNLKTIPKNAAIYWNVNGSSFNKQMEIRKAITAFCEQPGIKKVWLSRERQSTSCCVKRVRGGSMVAKRRIIFPSLWTAMTVFEVFYTEKIAAPIVESPWTIA